MFRQSVVVIMVSVLFLHGQAQPAPMRVDTDIALQQVVKKVDPVFPPEVLAANPGAPLAANVVIAANGIVESVTIVVGPAALHAPTIAALRQWTFKPFVNGGRPVRAIALIDIKLPNPAADADRKSAEAFFTALPICSQRLAAQSAEALLRCAEVARLGEALSADRALEKSHGFSLYGLSLLRADRPADALAQFERALDLRLTRVSDPDADNADLLRMIGESHRRLGNLQRADEALRKAVDTMERAIVALPSLQDRYTERLHAFLQDYAELKRSMGQTAEAKALEARAGALTLPVRGVPLPAIKRISGVQLAGAAGPLLTDDDVRKILALVPAGKKAWLIQADRNDIGSNRRWWISVYLEPDVVRPGIQRGPILTAATILPAAGAYAAPNKTWSQERVAVAWAQVPLPGRSPSEVLSQNDRNRPFDVARIGGGEAMSDDDLTSLVAFLRSVEKNVTPPTRANLYTAVQPWPIRSVTRWSDEAVEVMLREDVTADGPGQSVKLKRTATSWSIAELAPR